MSTPNSERRIIRAELVIGMLALLTSACASVAALVQTHATVEQTKTIAQQFGASVWPYLTFDTGYSPTRVSESVTNQGLGPALVRTFGVTIDGRPQDHWRSVIDFVDPEKPSRTFSQYDVEGGSVLRPGEGVTILQVRDRALRRAHAEAAFTRIATSICYCSLLKECWTLSSQEHEPRAVAACGPMTKPLAN